MIRVIAKNYDCEVLETDLFTSLEAAAKWAKGADKRTSHAVDHIEFSQVLRTIMPDEAGEYYRATKAGLTIVSIRVEE